MGKVFRYDKDRKSQEVVGRPRPRGSSYGSGTDVSRRKWDCVESVEAEV